ncbi:MAG TPA: hypothetical protein VJI98_00690 [Candidatus Nanoarchaeia archaeon]|nr:hypothetical protein [Candidatus Nanoarchaeia archaeon]
MALEPILDVWGVHGEVITMEYNRSAAVIDLFPFFEQMFWMRDDWLGSPLLSVLEVTQITLNFILP